MRRVPAWFYCTMQVNYIAFSAGYCCQIRRYSSMAGGVRQGPFFRPTDAAGPGTAIRVGNAVLRGPNTCPEQTFGVAVQQIRAARIVVMRPALRIGPHSRRLSQNYTVQNDLLHERGAYPNKGGQIAWYGHEIYLPIVFPYIIAGPPQGAKARFFSYTHNWVRICSSRCRPLCGPDRAMGSFGFSSGRATQKCCTSRWVWSFQ